MKRVTSVSAPCLWLNLVRYMMNSSVALVIRKRLSCPMFSTSGLLFMMVLTLARGNSTSLDLRGEPAETVVGVARDPTAGWLMGVAGVADILGSEIRQIVS